LARESGVTRVSKAYIERLYSLSGGHPAIARMIAGASYEERADIDALSIRDLRKGLAELALMDKLGYFIRGNLWEQMTPEEQAVLLKASRNSVFRYVLSGMRRLSGMPAAKLFPEATANLYSQGILRDGKIIIGALRTWLREQVDIEAFSV
jgi:hypothetical protein